MRLLNEQQVSACECAYRLSLLHLPDSSRECVFLNTWKPEHRYRLLRFDESNTATGYCSNIFGRYEKRPIHHAHYDSYDMSLTEFAMVFEPYYKKQDNSEDSIDQDAYKLEQHQ